MTPLDVWAADPPRRGDDGGHGDGSDAVMDLSEIADITGEEGYRWMTDGPRGQEGDVVELLLFLATKLAFLVEPGRFAIVGSRSSNSQGGDALIDLRSDTLRIRLTRDRGQILMAFQPLSSDTDWFSPGLLRGLLTGVRPGSEVLDDAWAAELAVTLPELERRLADPEEADGTIRELRRQAELRAEELFG